MRFMTMVKGAENSGPPPKALMDAMAKLCEEGIKAGTLIGLGGLLQRPRARESGSPVAS